MKILISFVVWAFAFFSVGYGLGVKMTKPGPVMPLCQVDDANNDLAVAPFLVECTSANQSLYRDQWNFTLTMLDHSTIGGPWKAPIATPRFVEFVLQSNEIKAFMPGQKYGIFIKPLWTGN